MKLQLPTIKVLLKAAQLGLFDAPAGGGGGGGKPKKTTKKKTTAAIKRYKEKIAQAAQKHTGGPYIGPRGGKWADPKHTIPWKEPTAPAKGPKQEDAGRSVPAPEFSIEDVMTHAEPHKVPGGLSPSAKAGWEWAMKTAPNFTAKKPVDLGHPINQVEANLYSMRGLANYKHDQSGGDPFWHGAKMGVAQLRWTADRLRAAALEGKKLEPPAPPPAEPDVPETTAYKTTEKKKHDLPGEWQIRSLRLKTSEFGEYWGATAVNEASGEKIWFRLPSLHPKQWEPIKQWKGDASGRSGDGPTFKLSGKYKGQSDDGGLAFMTNMSVTPTKEEVSAKKQAQKTKAAKRKTLKADIEERAKDPGWWATTTPQQISHEITNAEVGGRLEDKAHDLWAANAAAAAEAGDINALDKISQYETDLTKLSPGIEAAARVWTGGAKWTPENAHWKTPPKAALVAAAIEQVPALAEQLRERVHVMNPVVEKLRQDHYDAERAQREAANEGDLVDVEIDGQPVKSPEPEPFLNVTGYDKVVKFKDLEEASVPRGRVPDKLAQDIHNEISGSLERLSQKIEESTQTNRFGNFYYHVGQIHHTQALSEGAHALRRVLQNWKEFLEGHIKSPETLTNIIDERSEHVRKTLVHVEHYIREQEKKPAHETAASALALRENPAVSQMISEAEHAGERDQARLESARDAQAFGWEAIGELRRFGHLFGIFSGKALKDYGQDAQLAYAAARDAITSGDWRAMEDAFVGLQHLGHSEPAKILKDMADEARGGSSRMLRSLSVGRCTIENEREEPMRKSLIIKRGLELMKSRMAKASAGTGPFKGPRGGLWADAAHTIPYSLKGQQGKVTAAQHKASHIAHEIHHTKRAIEEQGAGNELKARRHLEAAEAHKVAKKVKGKGWSANNARGNAHGASERAKMTPTIADTAAHRANKDFHQKRARDHEESAHRLREAQSTARNKGLSDQTYAAHVANHDAAARDNRRAADAWHDAAEGWGTTNAAEISSRHAKESSKGARNHDRWAGSHAPEVSTGTKAEVPKDYPHKSTAEKKTKHHDNMAHHHLVEHIHATADGDDMAAADHLHALKAHRKASDSHDTKDKNKEMHSGEAQHATQLTRKRHEEGQYKGSTGGVKVHPTYPETDKKSLGSASVLDGGLVKSHDPDLRKGGEGSRGGKVIGHTAGGKPIYAHEGVQNALKRRPRFQGKEGNKNQEQWHNKQQIEHHEEMARQHRSAGSEASTHDETHHHWVAADAHDRATRMLGSHMMGRSSKEEAAAATKEAYDASGNDPGRFSKRRAAEHQAKFDEHRMAHESEKNPDARRAHVNAMEAHHKARQAAVDGRSRDEQDRASSLAHAASGFASGASSKKSLGPGGLIKSHQLPSGNMLHRNKTTEALPHLLKSETPDEMTDEEKFNHQPWGPTTFELDPSAVDGYSLINYPGRQLSDLQAKMSDLFGAEDPVEVDENGHIPDLPGPFGSRY